MKSFRIVILSLALCVAPHVRSNEISEAGCEVYLSSKQDFLLLKDFHVLGSSQNQGLLDIHGVKREDVKAVRCTRSSVVPVLSDARVLDAGWPLYIAALHPDGQPVIVVLEVSGGQYRLRTVKGQLSDAESEAVQQALNAIQNAAQQTVPADRPKTGSG